MMDSIVSDNGAGDALDALTKNSKHQTSIDTLKLSESSVSGGGVDGNGNNYNTNSFINKSSKGSHLIDAGAQSLNNGNLSYRNLERNPFVLPSDEEVFKMRESDKILKLAQREARKNLKVWEKAPSMYDSGINMSKSQRIAEILKKGDHHNNNTKNNSKGNIVGAGGGINSNSDDNNNDNNDSNNNKIIPPPAGVRARGQEKENMAEFIAKKREMFLVQMSLDTKREEIRKLEEKAAMKEDALRKSEQMLEEDAVSFDSFLKENDKKAHDAIKKAEQETKRKTDKVQEIKRLNQQIQMVQSEMSKHNEALQDCEKYKEFLDALTPGEYFEDMANEKKNRQRARRAERMKEREQKWENVKNKIVAEFERKEKLEQDALTAGRKSRKKQDNKATEEYREKQIQSLIPAFPDLEDEPWTSSGDETPMYFNSPQQLLDIFLALEEQNLFLIQNSQETEQALEELKQNFKSTKQKMDSKTSSLKENINELKVQIDGENSRANQLRKRILGSTTGENQGLQGMVLGKLHNKVKSVYETCGFDITSSPSTLFMLSELEAKLEEMLGDMDKMPDDYVHRAEKEKEKKRREKKRQEQQEFQERQQEERNRKSMERSLQAPKKRVGRQVMKRSKPIRTDKREEKEEINEDQLDEIRFLTESA